MTTWTITDAKISADGSRVWLTIQEQGGRRRTFGYLGAGEAAVLMRTGAPLFDGKPAKEAR